MIRTYVFGCHEQIEGLKTFSVNVNFPGNQVQETDVAQQAMDAAVGIAKDENLATPTLLFEAGTPEIRVILNSGEVSAVYYRNSEVAPAVSVTDLDYADDTEKEKARVLYELEAGCFTLLPHVLQ